MRDSFKKQHSIVLFYGEYVIRKKVIKYLQTTKFMNFST